MSVIELKAPVLIIKLRIYSQSGYTGQELDLKWCSSESRNYTKGAINMANECLIDFSVLNQNNYISTSVGFIFMETK